MPTVDRPTTLVRRFSRGAHSMTAQQSIHITDSLAARYQHIRQHSMELVRGLSAEDCQLQSMPEASPIKWHLAHTSWFFETFILGALPCPPAAFDPAFAV